MSAVTSGLVDSMAAAKVYCAVTGANAERGSLFAAPFCFNSLCQANQLGGDA
ncbi:hypothetical protein ACO0LH_15195 [Undibacterium sp. TJN19]